ncbi:unnamed protein product [Choristocarpus tenellus]
MGHIACCVLVPIQGGFLIIKPDMKVFEDLCEVVRSTPFQPGRGWGGSKIGIFWGGITVQGILPYFYEVNWERVDRCVYNNMVDTRECQSVELDSVRSAHFTNCMKPWKCLYPHPQQSLCTILFEQWFLMRKLAEEALGIPHLKPCEGFGEVHYQPMAFHAAL